MSTLGTVTVVKSVAQGFDDFLNRLVPTATERQAATSHRATVERTLRDRLEVNLFREIGSFNHGTAIRGHADVDILVSLKAAAPTTSDTALSWVRNALLSRYRATAVQVRRPAVVVNFAGGGERWEVVPGFRVTSADSSPVYKIPAGDAGWMLTAPLDHLRYVNQVNQKTGVSGAAKKLARLAKAWKYTCNVPISSFFLEMRAAKYMSAEGSFLPVWDLYGLLRSIHDGGLAAMNDPLGLAGRINPCSSAANHLQANSKLSTAVTRAGKAAEASRVGDFATTFHYLNLLFNGSFPAR